MDFSLFSLNAKVNSFMVTSHCWIAGKPLATYWTFVWFFTGMNIHMVFQSRSTAKAFWTLCALERFLIHCSVFL